MIKKIQSLLGAEADDLLNHKCTGFSKESLHLPGPDFIDRVWMMSDRSPGVLRSLASLFGHGRLARDVRQSEAKPLSDDRLERDRHRPTRQRADANRHVRTVEFDARSKKRRPPAPRGLGVHAGAPGIRPDADA